MISELRNMETTDGKYAGRRIQVVDDDVDMADGLADFLELHGFTVRTANSFSDAKDLVDDFHPDVALIDLRLGQSSGLDLIPKLKEKCPNLVCVIATAFAELETAIVALQHGAYDYMQKPLRSDHILAVLDRCFDRLQLEQDKDTAEKKLRSLNQELEQRIAERTKELTAQIEERIRTEVELRKAKEAADTANRAKSGFLANMSHELRTPMNAILGFAQMLESLPEDKAGEKSLEYIGYILSSGNHLLQLINDILDLSRIESGKLTFSLEEISPADAYTQSMDLIRPLAEDRGIEIKEDMISANDVVVIADYTRFRQILTNLLSNAVKYNCEGGTITVSSENTGDGMHQISITDTGNGIPEQDHHLLFQPFNRLVSENSVIEGTGIGLAITKQLVEHMGGSIGFESALGEGSTFWVRIPLANWNHGGNHGGNNGSAPKINAPGGPSITLETLPKTGPYKVLYVEDNPTNIKLMVEIVHSIPDVVLLTAVTAEDGIEQARLNRPDLIILDINLPEAGGMEVLRHLKAMEETRLTPVVALSANAELSDVKKGLRAGFCRYLAKPINIKTVRETIVAIFPAAL